jgi:hypothetical protein
LTPQQRRRAKKGLRFLQALTPTGPAFCFVTRFDHAQRVNLTGGGPCSTFKDASDGYALNEIDRNEQPQFFVAAALVPDGVATVVLNYRRHAPIRAGVTDNVYSARVPRFPPLGTQPMRAAVLRKTIINDLPTSVVWLGADGHQVRAFSPPAAYVRLLMRRYQGCVAIRCGA